MSGLLPTLPADVLGRPLPGRFHRASLRWTDADRLLVDFVAWIEDGDDTPARELAILVRGCEALRPRLPSRALDAVLARALPPDAEPEAPRPRPGLWPALPERVLGLPLPRRFRGWSVRFADADRVLVALVDWLEAERPALASRRDRGQARETLARACIDLRERLERTPLDAELRSLLAEVGITEYVADGERFDPDVHHAAGATPTDDPGLHDRIASTDRLGYRDRDRVLLAPEVIVYRAVAR